MNDLNARVGRAVAHFWSTRLRQGIAQGGARGRKDYGSRSEVTGGAHMDGFVELIAEIVTESGIPNASIFREKALDLPGFFRPTKEWDLLIIVEGQLLACCEFKSQVGSFGNNFNNRAEEAIGTAQDLWTAYREGAFRASARPWLGWLMLLEKSDRSTRPVAVREPHFPVFEEFRNASYVQRYELLGVRLMRERMYDAACLLLSDRTSEQTGQFEQPNSELMFDRFAAALSGHAAGFARMRGNNGESGRELVR